MPTEAEWNYAAAGGADQRVYPWGSTAPGGDANLAVYGCNYNGIGSCTGVSNIAPVGSVSAGNGKYGQADLAGNVFEWTLDWYETPYPTPCTNCAATTAGASSTRLARGGTFDNVVNVRASDRVAYDPTSHINDGGARCARRP